jgi:EAL domain-containing protein (putative c-di-GMP-specific phosphodiesterase class I)/GGDEF domain-containing protein
MSQALAQSAGTHARPAAGRSKAALRTALPRALGVHAAAGSGPLARLMRDGRLYVVFQPIASMRDGGVFGHEALIRGPMGTPLHTPDALLQAAREEGLLYAFELHCAFLAVRHWGALGEAGRLFVNISADALVHLLREHQVDAIKQQVVALGVSTRMLVLELTEHERVADMEGLLEAAQAVHASGVSLALDDFGDGRSSLRLWSQLRPDFVKIDKYFTRDVSTHAHNLLTLKALMQIAETFGTALVAEGIELQPDARVIRDLGVSFGQGYLLGRPGIHPRAAIEPAAADVLADSRVSVFPEARRPLRSAQLRSVTVIDAPIASLATSNDQVAEIFLRQPELHAIAVVDGDRPQAIINRHRFLNHYATPFFKELHGRKSCLSHANGAPRLIERDHDIDELVGILTSQDQRYLSDGFIVTDNGRYVGLGTGEQLVRAVTEARIEAARHANPLTFLPGNIPITQHIGRLLERGTRFVACYADLNHFKPFNDLYGYWRGDEMIRLAARLATLHCDAEQDFVGHVGGDDFLWIFQSSDWERRTRSIIDEFAPLALALFDAQAQRRGGIEAEDRHGVMRFFPCTTLSAGAVIVNEGRYRTAEQVANAAAFAKQDAKRRCSPLTIVEAGRR